MADEYDDESSESAAAAIGGIGGAIPGLNIFAPGIAETIGQSSEAAKRRAMVKNAKGIGLPQFDQRDFSTIDYMGDFRPEAYATPEAASYDTINVDPRTREIAMQALGRMQDFADQAATSQEALGRTRALDEANQMARAREGAISAAAQRRGAGGGGLEYVLRNQAAQQGAQQAQQGMLSAAQQAALQRLMGTQASMAGAQGIRGQDTDLAARNAAIVNAFNMYNTGARNQASQGNVDTRNQAGLRNINMQQGLAGQNAGIRNAGMLRKDNNAMNRFGAEAQKTGMVNSAIGGQAGQSAQVGTKANEAGKIGYDNFKDLMSMFGGMGGGGMGMGG